MVAHNSPALLLLRFFLPIALLFASCFTFTLPSFGFFVAFLVQHYHPRYEVTSDNFPTVQLLVLAVYSTILIIAHIVLGALNASQPVLPSTLASLAKTLAIPNYESEPWQAIKLLLAPLSVLVVTLAVLNSSKPNGEGRYLVLRRKAKESLGDSSSETSDSSSSTRPVQIGSASIFELEMTPAALREETVDKFARHMAGRGGIFWTTIACGFTGLSYSSILTLIYLAAFSLVVVLWAFLSNRIRPKRHMYTCFLVVRSFRVYMVLYLVFISVLQNPLFVEFMKRDDVKYVGLRNVLRLVGFVILDTREREGWAYITGFCFAIATYVFSGIFVNSLNKVILARNRSTFSNTMEPAVEEQETEDRIGSTLTYYDTQFLQTVLHLSSIGLLTWSLVFPGILTSPMLFAALAYFASKRVRASKVFDRIIVYAICLQIAHFLFVAVLTSFPSIDKSSEKQIIRLLGLRKFQPQFTMNLVQALALGLFCTNIFCKRYINQSLERNSQESELNVKDFVLSANYSATALKQQPFYSVLKLILDSLALVSLFIAAGTHATVLNSVFLISLCVLCVFQAFGGARAPKVMLFLWTMILAYSTVFLLITCTACRAIEIESSSIKCNQPFYGLRPARNVEVVAYTATIVLSAVQVHFTWAESGTSPDSIRDEYKTKFWKLIRKYYLFLNYVALLLYPLVHPANFLSYGYVLFLAISIVVELLGPYLRRDNRNIRPLIKAYWPTVVIFSVCALISRYIVRFDRLSGERLAFARQWIFGYDRISSIQEFHFTVGDASILIIVSLQGRFFGIESLVDEDQDDELLHGVSAVDRKRGLHFSATGPRPVVHESTVDHDIAQQRRIQPSGANPSISGSVTFRHVPVGIEATPEFGARSVSLPWLPSRSNRGSVAYDESVVRGNVMAERERLHALTEKFRIWRQSLPVMQTEKFLENVYNHSLILVRNSLLHYSFVLEACAILAAAVWLPGFSVFGAVYTILGCVLLLSEQAVYDSKGLWTSSQRLSSESNSVQSQGFIMRILPIVLAILSFALMSLQYVYLVASKIQEVRHLTHLFEYFGLQTPHADTEKLPIDEPAMIAHVLVFVTAFLQRVAVKWAARDAKKKLQEEQHRQGFNQHLLSSLQSHEALESALNINEVLGWTREQSSNTAQSSTNPSNRINEAGFVDSDEMMPAQDYVPPLDIGSSARFDPALAENQIVSEKSSDSFSNSETNGTDPELATKATIRLQKIISKMKVVFWDFYSLLNPFWLMWGFDLTFMYLVVGGAVTRTSFAVIYVALVMAVSGCRRARIARHWHHITLLLACLVLLQYFMTLRGPDQLAQPKSMQSGDWSEWLYVDKRNNTIERKYDVTFAFLAVICASMTLNAVSPGCRGFGFWFKRHLTFPEDGSKHSAHETNSRDSEMKENEIPRESTNVGLRKTSAKRRNSSSEPLRTGNSVDQPGTPNSSTESNQNPPAISHDFWELHSRDEDFTTRPMNAKNLIKLYWMRFSGSLVQLYMFSVAVSVTSVFNGVLLLLSFYFLFNFQNVNAKRSYFFIVRFYVLSVVFILVVYQAPFPALSRWAEVLGLRKTDDEKGTGELLLSLMVSLWLICQMQGRIYESKSFKYVVKYGKEDAEVRFKRAVHDHNTRKYERMLGRNKNRRAKMAREKRLDRLRKLKTAENRSVDRFYQVCVVDEMKVLRANVESRKGKSHIFSSHVAKKEEEKSPKESKLRVILRFLFRGPSWKKYRRHPLVSEFRLFMSRYSAWAVYATMLLATIVNPTELTSVYPLCLFLYLILEQPRPPKKVWQFLMLYVCLVISGKYVVREWDTCDKQFFTANPVEQKQSQVCRIASGIFFDILIFLSLLWHRTILYNRGLWDLQSSEEDMLLTNEIQGEKIETDASMELKELPEDPDVTSPSLPSMSPTFAAFWSSESQRSRSVSYNRLQQCNDVFEVLKRSRNKLSTMVGIPEASEKYWQAVPERKNPRERMVTFQSILPRSDSDVPPSAPPRTPSYAPLGDLNRFLSSRVSRTRTETGSTETFITAPKQIAPAQHAVQKSLVQSKVIPQTPEFGGPSRSLSLFRANNKSGLLAGVMDHFRKLTKEQEHKAVGDYYILIFLVDFLSFVVVTFGFSSIFGEDSFQLPWWRANFIEIVHLLTLMAMFLGLVLDRVVYLTRSMKGKLALQYASVVAYHVVIFFLPRRKENIRLSPLAKIFYMLRCVYFLLSGLQIRNGFPKYTTAQFLLRNYNTPGIIMFEIYNFIPFLWLMRTLLDWAVVPTSLEIFQYFRFVDIYIWLYRNRAVNTARGCFQRKLGQQRRWLPRVYQGFGIFLLCALALFLPFLFFSVLNPFTSDRTPTRATSTIDLLVSSRTNSSASPMNNATTLYNLFTRTTFIPKQLNKSEIENLADELKAPSQAKQRQSRSETYLIDFGPISDEEWELPETSKNKLVLALQNVSKEFPAQLMYQLTAKTSTQEFKLAKGTQLSLDEVSKIRNSIELQSSTALKISIDLPVYAVLDSGSTKFREPSRGQSKQQEICLRHLFSEPNGTNADSVWTVQPCNNGNCTCVPGMRGISGARNRFLMKFAVVSHLQVGGTTILTLYAAILFTLANFMRGFFSDKRLIIPYIDMPYTLHLYQLVLDIMYARQDNDLIMEEILYNGLTDIYRDQHVLAKWSGERALKLPVAWWENSEYREAYYCYPSFANTETEPHMTRLVE